VSIIMPPAVGMEALSDTAIRDPSRLSVPWLSCPRL